MGITYGKLLYCHGVLEGNIDRKVSTLEYNNRTFYDCFNYNFTEEFGSPDLNIPPITIDDIPRPDKRASYTPDLLPATISVDSEKYVSTLTTTYDYTDFIPSYDPNNFHVMMKYEPYLEKVKHRYCYRKHDKKYATKR